MTYPNQLISRLAKQDRHHLLMHGKCISLVQGDMLFERGESARHVYFPTSGAVGLQVPSCPARALSVMLVGREGMLGVQRVLGDGISPLRAVVQIPGKALRVDAVDFDRMLAGSSTLRMSLLSYVGIAMNQIVIAAACAKHHDIRPRLAGWLLTSRDRGASDTLHITQLALALLLGVRRVGITAAARELQHSHLIAYHRGDITILDVPGLRLVAGQSYAVAGRRAARTWLAKKLALIGIAAVIPDPI